MTVVNTRIVVSKDGSISLGEDLPAGEYAVAIEVSDPLPGTRAAFDAIPFPRLNVKSWPKAATFSREEIYGDDGR